MSSMAASAGTRRQLMIAGVVALLIISLRFLWPDYIDNETMYAIGPIRMLHPGFLAGHPWNPRINPFFVVFDAVAAPFYLLFDPLAATILLRILIWTFEVWALWRLLEVLGLRWWTMPLLVLLWIDTEQTLVAGEWVFGCASGKPVGYGFLFLALREALLERDRRAGLFAGLATSFHVLVGGWGAAALGVAILLRRSAQPRLRRLLEYGGPATLAALPGLVPAALQALSGPSGGASAAEVARIDVTIANPFHLDPAYFLTAPEGVKLLFYLVSTLALCWFLLPRRAAVTIVSLLSCLAACFAFGLVARKLEWFGVLRYYPFRVADGLYPLFFWVGVSLLLQRLAVRTQRWAVPVVAVASVLLLAAVGALNAALEGHGDRQANRPSLIHRLTHGEPRLTAYWVKEKSQVWRRKLEGNEHDDFGRLEDWIRYNTPANAVFVIPPWQYSFPLRARRIEFITFKSSANAGLEGWLARWEAVNGGPFHSVGWGMVQEARESYQRLAPAQLLEIRARFRGDYVVTTIDYDGAFRLVHQEGEWRLYQLGEVPGARP
jgi:hypothetical protein